MSTRHDAFASTNPGLEPLLADELRSLGIRVGAPGHGGVPFVGGDRDVYLVTAASRLALRVLVRISSAPVRTLQGLEDAAWDVPWAEWFPRVPDIKASSVRSRIFHTGAIEQRMVEAASHLINRRPGGQPAVAVVRIEDDTCTVSADAAGETLDRRGWRGPTGKAPLKPTLAAALLRATGWSGGEALVDPLCGSGTIPVEAARLAAGLPAWIDPRPFAFQSWPRFAPGTWGSVQSTLRSGRPTGATIVAADRDAGAVETTTTHLRRAGVGDAVTVHHGAISTVELPGPEGVIVTNPPWGGRIGGDLRDLYASLGGLVTRRPGWRAVFLTPDPALARATGLDLRTLFATTTGGRRVTAYEGRPRR